MKTLTLTLVAAVIITLSSCQKEQITPSKPDLKAKPVDCRKCQGSWDLTDTIPTNP